MIGKTTRHAGSRCWNCKHPLDASTHLDGVATPDPGDLTVCLYCGSVLVYDDGLMAIKPADDMLEKAYAEDPDLKRQITMMQRAVTKLARDEAKVRS